GYARLPYGYGSGAHKQGRYRQVPSTARAVPVGAQPGEGPTRAGATVLASVRALREPARGTAFVLMGDRKLLAATNRPARLAAERGYLASLARPPAWDAAVRALAAEPFPPVAGVSARDRARPAAERASHPGWETPTASGGTGAAKAAPRWLGRRGGASGRRPSARGCAGRGARVGSPPPRARGPSATRFWRGGIGGPSTGARRRP